MGKAMSLYLCNPDIECIVLKRIKNSMQQVYMDLCQIVVKNYNVDDKQIIAYPTSEQISLWMTVGL